jgi:isopentenyl phosphate kinase
MILIKLGGSIITNKKKPLFPRIATIHKISKQLKKINEPVILVHGGGSLLVCKIRHAHKT